MGGPASSSPILVVCTELIAKRVGSMLIVLSVILLSSLPTKVDDW